MENNKKALAIIAFTIVMLTLLVAVISDVAIFANAIISFIIAIIVGAIVFMVALMLMIISFCFIFGFYLIDQYGFWPLTWSTQFFNEVMADGTISSGQVQAFIGFRIAFLVICIITIVLAIMALHKDPMVKNEKIPLKGMSIATIVFSVLGIITAIGMLTISFAIIH